MFKRPTTIVVGAGCSREYGLPLGDELRLLIVEMLSKAGLQDESGNHIGDTSLYQGIQRSTLPEFHEFWYKKAHHMADGLQHASSIDRYLEIHQESRGVVPMGKMAIARQILDAEYNSSLFMEEYNEGPLNFSTIYARAEGPNWLQQLFFRMQDGVRRSDVDKVFTNLKFISFNYDRVIEHYLFHAVKSLADLTLDQASEAMNELHVFHPYGSIGRLPWQRKDGLNVRFGGHPKYGGRHYLDEIAANLRIFTETIEENDEIRNIRQAIEESEQIIFVGFSFLPQNLEILRPLRRSAAARIYGTTFGESSYNIEAAKTAVAAMLTGQNSDDRAEFVIQTESATAGQFFAMAGNIIAS